MTKDKGGRPTKLNKDTVKKLEQAASLDCSIGEMCFYADISRETYYNWIEQDQKLKDRLTALRNKPVLKARQEVVKGLDGDPEFSLKYLERKRRVEFATQQNIKADVTDKTKHENISEAEIDKKIDSKIKKLKR